MLITRRADNILDILSQRKYARNVNFISLYKWDSGSLFQRDHSGLVQGSGYRELSGEGREAGGGRGRGRNLALGAEDPATGLSSSLGRPAIYSTLHSSAPQFPRP